MRVDRYNSVAWVTLYRPSGNRPAAVDSRADRVAIRLMSCTNICALEFESRHELHPSRRPRPNGSSVQYIGDAAEAGSRRDIGGGIGEDLAVEQVERLPSELHPRPGPDGNHF